MAFDPKTLADEIGRLRKIASLTPWVKAPTALPRHRGDIVSACKGHPQKPVAQILGQQDYEERAANTDLVCLLMSSLDAIEAALRAAPGAEAMRERCERICDEIAEARAEQAEGFEARGNETGAIAVGGLAEGAKACAAVIRALSPDPGSAPVEGWRPMSSAPRDGTLFWAVEPGRRAECRQFVCWWERNDHDGTEYWQDDADSEPEPTAWRPLPPSPGEPSRDEDLPR